MGEQLCAYRLVNLDGEPYPCDWPADDPVHTTTPRAGTLGHAFTPPEEGDRNGPKWSARATPKLSPKDVAEEIVRELHYNGTVPLSHHREAVRDQILDVFARLRIWEPD